MLKKSSRILVTGGHGFIVSRLDYYCRGSLVNATQGGHVARRLHHDGFQVKITDIVPAPAHGAPFNGEAIIGNLCDVSFCARVVQNVDVVLHFAATMGGMGTIHAANDFIIFRENLAMTVNLLEACASADVKRFLYASSACVYPESLQSSGSDIALSEDDVWKNPPPAPQHFYGLEKLVGELVLQRNGSPTLDIRIVRFHNIFGPMGAWCGGREKAPAAFLRKAVAAKLLGDADGPPHFEIWGDGGQRRSFCFIDDDSGVASGPGLGALGAGRPEKIDWFPYGLPSRREACRLPGAGCCGCGCGCCC